MTRTRAMHHPGDPCALWRTGARRLAIGVVGGVALGACSTGTDPPGNAETDRIAQVVANAISYPRQESANGLVRTALATNAGQDCRLAVIAADDIDADELTDPLARLVFRVQLDGAQSGVASDPPVTACYDAEFNFYGIIDQPSRTDCPSPHPETSVSPRPTSIDGPAAPTPQRSPIGPIVRSRAALRVSAPAITAGQ